MSDTDGNIRKKCPEYYRTRSQDLDKINHNSGQWYWDSNKSLENNKFDIIKAVILDEMKVQDIDNEDDWLLPEIKYEILQKQKRK